MQCPVEHNFIVHENVSVQWLSENECHTGNIESSPLCLNGFKYLLTRLCDCATDVWIPEKGPDCEHTQISYEKSNKCPFDYVSISDDLNDDDTPLCVLITEAQAWTRECSKSGASKTFLNLSSRHKDLILLHLKRCSMRQVWLPATWNYKSIRWALPVMFGDIVDDWQSLHTHKEQLCHIVSYVMRVP